MVLICGVPTSLPHILPSSDFPWFLCCCALSLWRVSSLVLEVLRIACRHTLGTAKHLAHRFFNVFVLDCFSSVDYHNAGGGEESVPVVRYCCSLSDSGDFLFSSRRRGCCVSRSLGGGGCWTEGVTLEPTSNAYYCTVCFMVAVRMIVVVKSCICVCSVRVCIWCCYCSERRSAIAEQGLQVFTTWGLHRDARCTDF